MALRPAPYHVVELCAGAGGLGLGIELAVPGARGVAYVEREAYAAATLVARMEEGSLAPAPVWSDLATFDARPWRGRVHCVASGDPCQPNSVAGRGLGASDDRFLIDQVLRVVDECRPLRLFRENVTGNADGQLAALVGPLEDMGYRVAAGIFSAAGVGASHRRERLFVMADAARTGEPRKPGELPCQTADYRAGSSNGRGGHAFNSSGELVNAPGIGWREGRSEPKLRGGRGAAAGAGSAMGDAIGRGDGGHAHDAGRGSVERAAVDRAGGGAVKTMADADSFGRWAESDGRRASGDARQSGPDVSILTPGPADARWPAILARAPYLEPAVRRMADGLACRVDRLRLCGNGVHPLAAGYAWLALDALHAEARRSRAAVVKDAA